MMTGKRRSFMQWFLDTFGSPRGLHEGEWRSPETSASPAGYDETEEAWDSDFPEPVGAAYDSEGSLPVVPGRAWEDEPYEPTNAERAEDEGAPDITLIGYMRPGSALERGIIADAETLARRHAGYEDEPLEGPEMPTEAMVNDWNIHNDHADGYGELGEVGDLNSAGETETEPAEKDDPWGWAN